jgi:hypothetical protein
MKAVYAKALKGALQAAFAQNLPQFEPYAVRVPKAERSSSTMQGGEQVFVWKARPDLWLFVSFIPHRTQERFTADVGWSTRQRFPWNIPRPTVHSLDRTLDEQHLDECMIDFVDLLVRATGSGVFFGWDVWKCSLDPSHSDYKRIFIAEDLQPVDEVLAAKRAEAAATSAVREIADLAMPYLRSLMATKVSK